MGLCFRLKKPWNMKVTVIPILIASWNNSKTIGKRTGRLGNKSKTGDHPDYPIIKIRRNSERVLQLQETCCHSNSRENHRLTRVLKTHEYY